MNVPRLGLSSSGLSVAYHMDLSFRDYGGEGRPIVFLHGLFGSSQNWATVSRRLSARGHCYALDLRNHGSSPHAASHSLADCVDDLYCWVEKHTRGRRLALVGHSMGGLVAMGFAIAHPERTERLVVVDIAPRRYPVDHEKEFAALQTDIGGCRSRAEIDALLRGPVSDERLRAFLLTNAVPSGDGFGWRLNVGALKEAAIFDDFEWTEGGFEGSTLFLIGGRSESVRTEDHAEIRRRFPHAVIHVIPEADHWLPVSAPEKFARALDSFL